MHSPSAHALSLPQPLLYCPRTLKPRNAPKLVYKYYLAISLDDYYIHNKAMAEVRYAI